MCIVQTFRHESAAVKAHPAGKNGVVQVDYFGVFTDEAVENLVGKVVEEGARGRVIVLRIDRGIMAFTTMSAKARARFAGSKVPGAVVCRPDQYSTIAPICAELSAMGVLRLVFLDYFEAIAWADALAADFGTQQSARSPCGGPALEHSDRLLVGCRIAEPANDHTAKTARHR